MAVMLIVSRNLIAFLGNDSNKTELFYLIADVISEGGNERDRSRFK